jgi:hypothetical protein
MFSFLGSLFITAVLLLPPTNPGFVFYGPPVVTLSLSAAARCPSMCSPPHWNSKQVIHCALLRLHLAGLWALSWPCAYAPRSHYRLAASSLATRCSLVLVLADSLSEVRGVGTAGCRAWRI